MGRNLVTVSIKESAARAAMVRLGLVRDKEHAGLVFAELQAVRFSWQGRCRLGVGLARERQTGPDGLLRGACWSITME